MKRVLLLSDFLGYGKVACNAMIPIFNYLNVETISLPTSLVSNTLNYGKYNIFNTTAFIEDSLNSYKELNIEYQYIYAGFLFDDKQFEIIKKLKDNNDKLLICDPIMADNHKLYNGVDNEKIAKYLKLIRYADIIIPNYTESLLLCGYDARDNISYEILANKLKTLTKSFVITSYEENNEHFVIVYDAKNDNLNKIAYEYLPYTIAGSGDIFAAMLISNYLNNNDLYEASLKACLSMNKLIKANMLKKKDKAMPLAIEQYLDSIF